MSTKKILGNIVWWLFGGVAAAFEYATLGVAYCITIIGIPWGLQCFKLALVMLLPFGSKVGENNSNALGCVGNVIWFILGGLWIWLTHIIFGLLLFITIIGIPFANKHFLFARLALTPFGRDIDIQMD